MQHFPLVAELMSVLRIGVRWEALLRVIAIGHAWVTASVVGRRIRSNNLVPSSLRLRAVLLVLLHLLLGRELLVARRAKIPLTEWQQHLRGCRHRHNYCLISGAKPGIYLLDIAEALSRLLGASLALCLNLILLILLLLDLTGCRPHLVASC